MSYPNITTLQKVIIILFIATISTSCLSLLWITIEKPDKVTKICQHTMFFNDKPAKLEFINNTNDLNSAFTQNCTTTTNPPMSGGLTTMIDLSTLSGFLFVSASVVTLLLKRKEMQSLHPELDPETYSEPETDQEE